MIAFGAVTVRLLARIIRCGGSSGRLLPATSACIRPSGFWLSPDNQGHAECRSDDWSGRAQMDVQVCAIIQVDAGHSREGGASTEWAAAQG